MATLDRPRDELPDVPELAVALGLEAAEFEPYGRDKAKVDLSVLERLTAVPDGKLVAVTAVTPTKSGEGKTTTAISLTQGLGCIGERSLVCLREPSVGPTLGAKGGTGGGLAQVVPAEDINLHFTGDLHAIAAANNLLASAVDAHLVHGNELGINPDRVDHVAPVPRHRRPPAAQDRGRRRRGEPVPHARGASTSRPRQR